MESNRFNSAVSTGTATCSGLMSAFIKGFLFAWQGITDLFRHHRNAQFHAVAAITALCLGWYFQINNIEWIVVIICIGIVMALEAMNTAVEYLTDLVSPDFHPLAGKVKDMAAGAVLLGAIAAAVAGAVIFVPKIWAEFG